MRESSLIDYELLVPKLLEIVRSASDKILQVYESADFSVEYKKDNSPLTLADTLSHQAICEGLQSEFEYPILSEEEVIPYSERQNWNDFWLVDPLDGTKEFISKNGEFTVNIALILSDRPVLGIVAAPALDTVYYAVQGVGAYKLFDSKKEEICNNRNDAPLIASVSRSHSNEATQAFLKRNSIHETVSCGSSLKLCTLAEGRCDVYPRLSGSMEWDIAAGQCIAEQAGCTLYSWPDKQPLLYNKENLLNPDFIAARKGLNFIRPE